MDEGNGVTVLEVVVRLAQIEIPRPKVKSKPVMRSSTFRSRMERRNDPSSSTGSGLPAADNQLYMRPDIRVGDTVRVVGRVDEWSRGKKEWVRQLSVDMASGLGSISVYTSEVVSNPQLSSTPRKLMTTSKRYAASTRPCTPGHS